MTYRVQLNIAGYLFDETYTPGVAPAYYRVIDPLIVSWGLPDDAVLPAQPDPMVLQFSLYQPSTAVLVDVGIGSWVIATITVGAPGTVPIHFFGPVTDATATPLETGGVRYDFTCTDGSIDLARVMVSAVQAGYALPMKDRIARLLSESGLAAVDLLIDPIITTYLNTVGSGDFLLDSHDYNAAVLRDALVELCDWFAPPVAAALPVTLPRCRPVLAPYPAPSSIGTPGRWALDAVPDAWTATAGDYPYVFGVTGSGLWGPVPAAGDTGGDATYINACELDVDAAWEATLRQTITRAFVVWNVVDLITDPYGPRLLRKLGLGVDYTPPAGAPRDLTRTTEMLGTTNTPTPAPADISAAANAYNLARLLLPPPPLNVGWAPNEFTWRFDHDTGVLPQLFPDHTAPVGSVDRWRPYVRPLTIGDILEAWNVSLPGTPTLSGLLTGVKLTIEDATARVVFSLAPSRIVYAPGSTGALRWIDVPAGVPRWVDVDPHYTWADYALVAAP